MFTIEYSGCVIKLERRLPKDTIFGNSKVGGYLNTNEKFTRPSKKTWIFNTEKEAKNYTSHIYEWGCLFDYISIEDVSIIIENDTVDGS